MRLYRALYSLVCAMQARSKSLISAYSQNALAELANKLTGKRTASNTKRHL